MFYCPNCQENRGISVRMTVIGYFSHNDDCGMYAEVSQEMASLDDEAQCNECEHKGLFRDFIPEDEKGLVC